MRLCFSRIVFCAIATAALETPPAAFGQSPQSESAPNLSVNSIWQQLPSRDSIISKLPTRESLKSKFPSRDSISAAVDGWAAEASDIAARYRAEVSPLVDMTIQKMPISDEAKYGVNNCISSISQCDWISDFAVTTISVGAVMSGAATTCMVVAIPVGPFVMTSAGLACAYGGREAGKAVVRKIYAYLQDGHWISRGLNESAFEHGVAAGTFVGAIASSSAGADLLNPNDKNDSEHIRDPVLEQQGRGWQARSAFQRSHPCPANGADRGPCPGYLVDHVIPLCLGGFDLPTNMQWQTSASSFVKDIQERSSCRTLGLSGN